MITTGASGRARTVSNTAGGDSVSNGVSGCLGGRERLPLRRAARSAASDPGQREHAHVAPDLHRGQLDRADARRERLHAELRDLRREVADLLVIAAHRQLDAVGDRLRDLSQAVVAGVVRAPRVDVEVAALDVRRVDDAIERASTRTVWFAATVTVWRTSSYS